MERLNLNQCPVCGLYDWSHPTSTCSLTPEQCREEYARRIAGAETEMKKPKKRKGRIGPKQQITQDGLRSSLYAILEFGYKSCERAVSVQQAFEDARSAIDKLVESSNLETEILKPITFEIPKRSFPDTDYAMTEEEKRRDEREYGE